MPDTKSDLGNIELGRDLSESFILLELFIQLSSFDVRHHEVKSKFILKHEV
jgi:hypothetical protein